MADPEIPEVRAELQREDARNERRINASYDDKRARTFIIFMVALIALMAIAYLLMR